MRRFSNFGLVAFGLTAFAAAFSGSASAAPITGGNAVIARPGVDSFTDFSILDSNNPISGTGLLASWSLFAPAGGGPVELLIYNKTGTTYTVVGESALVTPAAGLDTFSLGAGLAVEAGDFVGLFFEGAAAAEYTLDPPGSNAFGNLSGTVLYSASGSGLANDTAFIDSTNRTYSVSVTSVPEPMTVALLGGALVAIGFARSRRRV